MGRRRHRSLDELDGDHWADLGISPYSTGGWDRKANLPLRGGSKMDLPHVSAGSVTGKPTWCWCGEVSHTWPGAGDGAPHPR